MKTILNILKTILKIGAQTAPVIVAAYNPALGKLVETVLTAVVNTEAAVGAGNGSAKATVSAMLLQGQGEGIAALFSTAGKPIKNSDLFSEGVNLIQEGVVKILNATGDGAKVPAAG